MTTECTAAQLEFHGLERRAVVGQSNGGKISSDSGELLLRELEQGNGVAFGAMVARHAPCAHHAGTVQAQMCPAPAWPKHDRSRKVQSPIGKVLQACWRCLLDSRYVHRCA